MKKIILPVILFLTLVFLPPKSNAQTNVDCNKALDQELYKCLTESNKCIDSCVDKARSEMSLTVDGGKVNLECRGSVCDPASEACRNKAKANLGACLDALKAEADSPNSSQPRQYPADIFDKIPVIIGGWFNLASAGIDLGEFVGGLTKGFTIADDAIIEDERYEEEWDKYRESYNSLKSKGLTHEQIEATLQKPRRRDVSMSPQELEALKVKLPAGESITNVPGTTDAKLYSWETDSGVLIKSTNWEKIEFKKPVVDGDVTTRTVNFRDGEIEVKARNANPGENKFGVDAGWLDVTVSRTHFWVLKDADKKLAIVGVYEGEVEVKTKDGQTIKVAPDGDKPGVVVVTQKLSVVKLVLVGLVIAGIVGGIIWLIKKKKKK